MLKVSSFILFYFYFLIQLNKTAFCLDFYDFDSVKFHFLSYVID